VYREEQGLQGEDEDLHQADPGHDRVNLSWAEQRLSGWLFTWLQAGGDQDRAELREDHVHQVLGHRARSLSRCIVSLKFYPGALPEEGKQPIVCTCG